MGTLVLHVYTIKTPLLGQNSIKTVSLVPKTVLLEEFLYLYTYYLGKAGKGSLKNHRNHSFVVEVNLIDIATDYGNSLLPKPK